MSKDCNDSQDIINHHFFLLSFTLCHALNSFNIKVHETNFVSVSEITVLQTNKIKVMLGF